MTQIAMKFKTEQQWTAYTIKETNLFLYITDGGYDQIDHTPKQDNLRSRRVN